ncbi:hypothetical protein ACIQVC_42490 [Streptomyces sp. NPDC101112]|uniref:hypothetical protein n=1 Tax=Streptomyces sp. NPDC101112 TaxID=3366105 RepID=UPI0037FE3104
MSSSRRRRLNDPIRTAPTETAAIWDGPTTAAPRVEMWARSLADAAAELHDIARPGGWNEDAAEDALEALELTAQALETVHPEAGEALAVARRVAAELRRLLHLPPPDTDSDGNTLPRSAARREEPRPRPAPPVDPDSRRGLGPAWQGL